MTDQAAITPNQPEAPQPIVPKAGFVRFVGTKGMFPLLLKNLALNIVTLSFYRFWARTAMRRWLWSRVELLGDRVEYTGTGGELFRGFLRAVAVLAPLVIVYSIVNYLFTSGPIAHGIAEGVFYLILLFLYYVAIFSARRYRLSRTVWRGVRFGQTGKTLPFAVRMFGWTLLTVATAGLAAPWMAVARMRYLNNATLFGDRAFTFSGKGKDLFLSWLLVYVTFGFAYIWYQLKVFRYGAEHTNLGPIRFRSYAHSGGIYGRLVLLYAINLVIIGIFGGAAVVLAAMNAKQLGLDLDQFQVRTVYMAVIGYIAAVVALSLINQILAWWILIVPVVRHICETFGIAQAEYLETVAQSSLTSPATGEGLADAFDLGLAS